MWSKHGLSVTFKNNILLNLLRTYESWFLWRNDTGGVDSTLFQKPALASLAWPSLGGSKLNCYLCSYTPVNLKNLIRKEAGSLSIPKVIKLFLYIFLQNWVKSQYVIHFNVPYHNCTWSRHERSQGVPRHWWEPWRKLLASSGNVLWKPELTPVMAIIHESFSLEMEVPPRHWEVLATMNINGISSATNFKWFYILCDKKWELLRPQFSKASFIHLTPLVTFY